MDELLPHAVALSESAVIVSWGNVMKKQVNLHVHRFSEDLRQQHFKGVIDIVPAYCSVTILFDLPVFISVYHQHPLQFIQMNIEKPGLSEDPGSGEPVTRHIPVCYDTALGNDLQNLSNTYNIPVAEIIKLHQSATYFVYMLGFLPGFSYMGEVDEKITFARKDKPVPVKAGSVAIAGKQTGIYPVDSPGGWNIIGYTPLKIFDASRSIPCILDPGNMVVFDEIDINSYHLLQNSMP